MRLETFQRLMGWLPKLAALEDTRRLAVLSQIDRILAADAITWDDLALTMMPPALPPDDLLMMTDTAAQWCESLDDHTMSFLAQLRDRAKTANGNAIYLTERQSGWLWSLYRKALNRRTRAQKMVPDEITNRARSNQSAASDAAPDSEPNVVYLAERVTA